MSIATNRRAVLALISVGAVTTVLAAPQPADAQTLYACVKKNGTARIYVKKPKCKKRETKLSWNTEGIPGLNGKNGVPGSQGPKGAEGPSGALAKPLVPTAAGLQNGWTEAGSFGTPSFAKDPSGFVHLTGAAIHSGASKEVIFTLPEGSRPKYLIDAPVAVFGPAAGALRINTDGTVEVVSGTTTFVDFESVLFFVG